ncbi:MAG: UDP-N-acetylmuramate--L-alanine ligase [Actinobacteria bacterium]|nr:UDP-N-acetylmuramate--L-alanine ligase [Actinomycetota bacterium]
MKGRKLWFIGIGGAGLSAYAQLARAMGAEVGGWDCVRTPYLAALGDVPVEISPEPSVPDGWEAVVSSAYPTMPGLRRAEFLAELVRGRTSIAVAGTHGKGTTAAMIAFVLHESRRDPAWLIGAPIPQLGSNAGFGAGPLVVEADESDRTVFALPATIAVVTNVELDHHTEYASEDELLREFDAWLARAGSVVRDAPPYDGPLALPGAYNRANAGAALAALELAGVPRAEAEPLLARFAGTSRRFEVHQAGELTIVDDYGHHPTEVSGTIQAARERFPGARLRVLFQPHLYSRTRHLARALAEALAGADDVTVTDIYGAREQPIPGVTGKLVIDALSDLGVLAGWTPSVEAGAERLAGRAQSGDVLIVLGAGDVDRAVGLLRG